MNEKQTKIHNILVCVSKGEYVADFAYGLLIELFEKETGNKIQKVFDDKEFDTVRDTKKFKKIMKRHLLKPKGSSSVSSKSCPLCKDTLPYNKDKEVQISFNGLCKTCCKNSYILWRDLWEGKPS